MSSPAKSGNNSSESREEQEVARLADIVYRALEKCGGEATFGKLYSPNVLDRNAVERARIILSVPKLVGALDQLQREGRIAVEERTDDLCGRYVVYKTLPTSNTRPPSAARAS